MFALDRLTIERFRGIQDLTLDQLGRVNLLVGPNDSGKTSVLEAISIFCQPQDIRAWLDATRRREALDPGEPFFLLTEWLFPHERTDDGPFAYGEVEISGDGRFLARGLRAVFTPISRIRTRGGGNRGNSGGTEQNGYEQPGARIQLTATAEIVHGAPPKEFERSDDLWEGETLPLRAHGLSLPVRVITPVSHRVEPIQAELTEATLAGQKIQILSLLKRLDPAISDFLILSPRRRSVVYLDYRSSGLLPLSAFGDGIRRAFSIAVLAASVAGGVLLIDEIESSLHVSALGSLFSWLVKTCDELNVQLFATTHSLEAVDAMLEAESEHLDRIVGYHLEAPEGKPRVQRLDGELMHRLRYERGLDVR
jgi:ABC-type transport system involved in cytochrome c biogenesis ATPase subunit